jgi:hypothetical protein
VTVPDHQRGAGGGRRAGHVQAPVRGHGAHRAVTAATAVEHVEDGGVGLLLAVVAVEQQRCVARNATSTFGSAVRAARNASSM